MLKKTPLIILFFIISALSAIYYKYNKLADGVISQGTHDDTLIFIALLTSIVSLLTALVGLIQKIIEFKDTGK